MGQVHLSYKGQSMWPLSVYKCLQGCAMMTNLSFFIMTFKLEMMSDCIKDKEQRNSIAMSCCGFHGHGQKHKVKWDLCRLTEMSDEKELGRDKNKTANQLLSPASSYFN